MLGFHSFFLFSYNLSAGEGEGDTGLTVMIEMGGKVVLGSTTSKCMSKWKR
jgi:hypothetical protein